jgi:hypothetical protein
LVVLNWTRWQWSQRNTSRESTGANAVAMDVWECQSRHRSKIHCVEGHSDSCELPLTDVVSRRNSHLSTTNLGKNLKKWYKTGE